MDRHPPAGGCLHGPLDFYVLGWLEVIDHQDGPNGSPGTSADKVGLVSPGPPRQLGRSLFGQIRVRFALAGVVGVRLLAEGARGGEAARKRAGGRASDHGDLLALADAQAQAVAPHAGHEPIVD